MWAKPAEVVEAFEERLGNSVLPMQDLETQKWDLLQPNSVSLVVGDALEWEGTRSLHIEGDPTLLWLQATITPDKYLVDIRCELPIVGYVNIPGQDRCFFVSRVGVQQYQAGYTRNTVIFLDDGIPEAMKLNWRQKLYTVYNPAPYRNVEEAFKQLKPSSSTALSPSVCVLRTAGEWSVFFNRVSIATGESYQVTMKEPFVELLYPQFKQLLGDYLV